MHLIERYALGTGAKIDKPYIYEDYFPISIDKYITFHPIGGSAKNYEHWQEVIDLIYPVLEKERVKIIQIGGNEKHQRLYPKTLHVVGQTNIPQLAYLINNSLLHVGIDSFPAQIAGSFNKKIVSLYSHVKPQHRKPFWGEEKNQILLESGRGGLKPSYAYADPRKSINQISPILIAESVCKLLDLEFNYDYESHFIGDKYQLDVVDIVPNRNESDYGTTFKKIRIRADLEFNEQGIASLLQNCKNKAEIITSNKIDLNLLKAFAEKIELFAYVYDGDLDKIDEQYIDTLNIFPFHVAFLSYEDEKANSKFKLRYMDHSGLNSQKWPTKEDANIDHIKEQIYYKSSKRILSNGNIYHSLHSYENNRPENTFDKVALPVENDDTFWKDLPCFHLLTKKS